MAFEGSVGGRLPRVQSVFPRTTIHHPAGSQNRGGLVKFELIPDVEVKSLPQPKRDRDLTLGGDGDGHPLKVRPDCKDGKSAIMVGTRRPTAMAVKPV